MSYSVLWLTHPNAGVPHRGEFEKHNSNIDQYIYTNTDTDAVYAWRNVDQGLMKFLSTYINEADYLLVLEWDVYINTKFTPEEVEGLGCRWFIPRNRKEPWYWFGEENSLPMAPCGISPFGVMLLSKKLITALKEYDTTIFTKDIFCELRFASVVKHLGFPITEMNNIEYVGISSSKTLPTIPSVHHPIKI